MSVEKEVQNLSETLNGLVKITESFVKTTEWFILEQREFNKIIENKIEWLRYTLDEEVAASKRMFFDEQTEQKSEIAELSQEVAGLKISFHELAGQVQALK